MGEPRRARSQRGAAAIEFALVMLPLVALLFGAIQYGLYFWAMQGGSDIARGVARDAAVGDTATATCTAFRTDVRNQINGLTGSGSTATITRTYIDAQTPPDGVTVGDKVRIKVTFRSVDMNFPFIPFVHNGMVTSTAESRVDYVPDPNHPPASCS